LGRGFEPQDERQGGDPVIVLQHEFWKRRFRGDPSVVGKKIYLANHPVPVIGVMKPNFVLFNREKDAFIPFQWGNLADERFRGRREFRAMARLKPGMSLEQ